ncbi:MAG: Fe-S-containing hydro-lyase [Dehalococcoidia bacterium]
MAEHHIKLPLTYESIEKLHTGDYVYLTGAMYTARDSAHKRMIEALQKGESLPVDIRGQMIYYVGPTPAKPGQIIGSAGPTTSMRMDPFTLPLLEAGLKGIIGKGGRGPQVREALLKHQAIYFLAVGGASAFLSKQIRSVEIVAYEDLGTEAMRRIEVEEFPVVVCNDIHGADLLEQGKAEWRQAEILGR